MHLAQHGLHLDLSSSPLQFKGGLANLNFMVRLDGELAVLRAPPSGDLPVGAHDMKREHRILRRLWKELPLAPRSLYLCEDDSVIGRPFILLEYKAGITLSGATPEPLEKHQNAGAQLGPMMIDVLADIHAVEPASVGLDTLGHPDGFIDRAVHGWIQRAATASGGQTATGVTLSLANWLRENQAAPSSTTLLHNDLKLDNIILNPQFQPIAVVDWDQGTRGDPLFDLATLLSYWTEAGDPPAMQQLGQMPTARYGFCSRREAAEYYSARTGRDLGAFRFHRVLTLFKLGVVFQQLHNRYQADKASDSTYAKFDELAKGIFDFAREVSQNRYF